MHDRISALLIRYSGPPPAGSTDDHARSARFAAVEAALRDGVTPAEHSSQIIRWALRVRDLTDFTATHGRFPRENNRAPSGTISRRESRLHEWVRLQRRATIRDSHCNFQIQRLELIPGFSWDPHGDAWTEKLTRYRDFIAQSQRAPRARSDDPAEQGLAHWAAKQRSQHRRNQLAYERETLLRSLSIWTW